MLSETTRNWALQACMPLAVIAACALPVPLQASIILPEKVTFRLEQLLTQRESSAVSISAISLTDKGYCSRSAATRISDLPVGNPLGMPKRNSEVLFALSSSLVLLNTGGRSNMGDSTTSSNPNGTSIFPMNLSATASLPARDYTRWVSGKRRLAIPIPLGTDLLRPPQEA